MNHLESFPIVLVEWLVKLEGKSYGPGRSHGFVLNSMVVYTRPLGWHWTDRQTNFVMWLARQSMNDWVRPSFAGLLASTSFYYDGLPFQKVQTCLSLIAGRLKQSDVLLKIDWKVDNFKLTSRAFQLCYPKWRIIMLMLLVLNKSIDCFSCITLKINLQELWVTMASITLPFSWQCFPGSHFFPQFKIFISRTAAELFHPQDPRQ